MILILKGMRMKKITMSAVALTAIMGSFSSVSAADGINILDNIKVDGQIRPRYEGVDDGNSATANANALTARTKLKASANLLGVDGLSASVGIISVNNFGYHEYNWAVDKTTTPATFTPGYTDGSKPYTIVADPQAAMISNAEVNYKTGDTLIHAGRGQVNLDNQRFIGTVGWRQLERSYDSVFVANNSIKNLSVLAAWVYGLQGVSANPTADTNTILLHAAYTVMPALKITAYDYMIASNGRSNDVGCDTYGLALTGKVKMNAISLNYRAEYAMQTDATMSIHDGDRKANADYINLDVSGNFQGILAGVNYELQSGTEADSNAHRTFATPLGTNHKFNGWADQFLKTPKGGLQDMNLHIGYKAKGFGKVLAVYHQFTADKAMQAASGTGTSDDLGSEIDFLYANKIPGVNNLTGLAKYASYSGGDVKDATKAYTNDVTKIWFGLDYKFATK